jgi:hypothetical protein
VAADNCAADSGNASRALAARLHCGLLVHS